MIKLLWDEVFNYFTASVWLGLKEEDVCFMIYSNQTLSGCPKVIIYWKLESKRNRVCYMTS